MALAQQLGDTVAINVVTTHALEEAIPTATVIRTAVGELNVVQGVIAHDAVLGKWRHYHP
jgi:phosphomannomutase